MSNRGRVKYARLGSLGGVRNKANFLTGENICTRTCGLPNRAINSPSYSPIGNPGGQPKPKIAKKSPKKAIKIGENRV